MPALAVSTVSAVPGQPSAAQTPAAVVLALPFATRLAGILDAALAPATGAASPSSQPTAADAQSGTTTAASRGADATPIAGWAWRVSTDAQGESTRSTRTRVPQVPHHQQRAGASQDAGGKSAGAVASAAIRKVEAGSSAPTIKLAEATPGGQDVPSGGNDRTRPGVVKPLSAGAARPASTPDADQALSGATGSAPLSPSPATNTLPAMPSATRPLRRAGADSRATPPDADQTASTGGKDAATPPTEADPPEHGVPSNTAGRDDDTPAASQTGEANAALSGATVPAAPDAAPARAARGAATGIRQVSSPAAVAEPAEVSPPVSMAAPDAPVNHSSPMSVPSGADHPSNRAGNTAPAPRTDPSAAAAPGTAGRADQSVPDAAAGRARPDAMALTSPAPAPDATALAASAAPASSDLGAAAAPASAAMAPRIAAATEPAAASPSALAAPTPAQQAVPALVSLGGGQGTRQVTVRLDPPELGRLQIRLVQPKDGPAQVTVTAERSQTLDLLVRDEVRLSRALDQAGVPAEGRSVTFHLAAAASSTAADPSRNAPSPATPAPQSTGTGASDAGNGSDRGPQRDTYASGQRRLAGGSNESEDDTPRAVRWLRTGINITA